MNDKTENSIEQHHLSGMVCKSEEPREISVTASFERVDARRNKKYGKKCTLTACVTPIRKDKRDTGYSADALHFFRNHVLNAYPKARVDTGYYNSSPWQVHLTHWEPASKPSHIMDDDVVRNVLPSDDEFSTIILHCWDLAEQEFKAQQNVQEIDRQAGRLLSWFRSEVIDDAKKTMRWDQRQAALLAELQAEVTAQTAKKLEEALTLIAEDQKKEKETGHYLQEAIELFKTHAIGYVAENKTSGRRRSTFTGAGCPGEAWLAKKRHCLTG